MCVLSSWVECFEDLLNQASWVDKILFLYLSPGNIVHYPCPSLSATNSPELGQACPRSSGEVGVSSCRRVVLLPVLSGSLLRVLLLSQSESEFILFRILPALSLVLSYNVFLPFVNFPNSKVYFIWYKFSYLCSLLHRVSFPIFTL